MSDLWTPDRSAAVALVELRVTALGESFLYQVHGETHLALGLPPLPAEVVREVYRAGTLPVVLAKADAPSRSEAWSRAAKIFEQLAGVRRVAGAQARALAEGITEKWFAQGLIETRAGRLLAVTRVIGLLAARGEVGARPASLAAALEIADPQPGARDLLEARAGELARGLKDATRRAVALEVVDAAMAGESAALVAARLTDRFATLNRDWRRVAVTEVAAARSHGFLAGLPDGARVRWDAAPDACPHCRGLHGREFTVRAAPGDPWAEVWAGKSNRGRALAARTREGRERGRDERAAPTIPLHPNCRCRFVRVSELRGSARLEAYLAHLASL